MNSEETPVPQVMAGAVLVETAASLVSAGTEKMLVDLARKSLVGKARSRPDLVKKVIDKAKREGLANTIQKVRSKLDNPIPLGYSCAGIVREVGEGVDEFKAGGGVELNPKASHVCLSSRRTKLRMRSAARWASSASSCVNVAGQWTG
jgi:NADPH:quinone reductase-like Zn-dependent oxidoreductase